MADGEDLIQVESGPWVATDRLGRTQIAVHHREADAQVATIGVWDHERGAVTIEQTADGVGARFAEWVAESGDEYAAQVGWG